MPFYKRKKKNQIKSVYIQFLLIEKLHLLAEGVCVCESAIHSLLFLIITSSSSKMSVETCFPSQLIQNILCICLVILQYQKPTIYSSKAIGLVHFDCIIFIFAVYAAEIIFILNWIPFGTTGISNVIHPSILQAYHVSKFGTNYICRDHIIWFYKS